MGADLRGWGFLVDLEKEIGGDWRIWSSDSVWMRGG